MSEQRRRKGPMGGRGMQPTEKAKDFKGRNGQSCSVIWDATNSVLC